MSLGDDEVLVWRVDASGTVRAADPTSTRLWGADPDGLALSALAAPMPPRDRPAATAIGYTAADGSRFTATTFTLPVGNGVLGVGMNADGAFVDALASRRARRVRGDEDVMALRELLGGVSAGLDEHATLAATFSRRSEFVEELAEEIRLFSLNAILAAHRVAEAAAIGAVAQLMQTRSDVAAPEILALRTAIGETGALLEQA